jgi:hypothetical protein
MAKSKNYSLKRGRAQPRRGLSPLLIVLGGAMILIVTLIIALQPSTNTSPTTPEVSGAARLKADKQKIDLGDVKLGTPVKVSFQLTNVGDQPLKLTKAPYVEIKEGC